MPRKKTYITVTDQFCGAGGSSQGVRNLSRKSGGGLEVAMALNHWKLAIETHSTNFPETKHDCTDISACDPRRYPPTDILITSPECTTHSPAGGNTHRALKKQMDMFDSGVIDPATERSRATMWDVCRFAEYHQYNIIIVENVVEAKTRWALFDNWLSCMHTLGYNHKCVYLNSMHTHPTPQSRDRMYIVFWKKGNKAPNLELTPRAYCVKCGTDVDSVQSWKNQAKRFGKYRTQYNYCCPKCTAVVEPYYYAAFNCIDWSDIGTRIGDRKIALRPKTLARIDYGLKKFGAQPMIVRNQTPGYCRPVTKQIGTVTTVDTNSLFTPFLIDGKQNSGIECRVKSTTDVTCTMHTDPRVGLLTPFIYSNEHGGRILPASMAKSTQTCTQADALVTLPFVTEFSSKGKARPVTRELNTATAGAVKSGIVCDESWKSFISYYYGTDQVSGINNAIGACSTHDRHQLLTYQIPNVEDCYFRMLFPREVKRAMAFDHDYVILGNSKDQVKQCGNAVTPPAMEFLIGRCVESLN